MVYHSLCVPQPELFLFVMTGVYICGYFLAVLAVRDSTDSQD